MNNLRFIFYFLGWINCNRFFRQLFCKTLSQLSHVPCHGLSVNNRSRWDVNCYLCVGCPLVHDWLPDTWHLHMLLKTSIFCSRCMPSLICPSVGVWDNFGLAKRSTNFNEKRFLAEFSFVSIPNYLPLLFFRTEICLFYCTFYFDCYIKKTLFITWFLSFDLEFRWVEHDVPIAHYFDS